MVSKMKKIFVVNGPNLNMLGKREPTIYGTASLEQLTHLMEEKAQELGMDVAFYQSNHEGEIIDQIQGTLGKYDGMIINPGAFTHYSYAISDAISAVQIPTVEVHISNIYRRESFRHHSVIAPVSVGQISGLGMYGYFAALQFFADFFKFHKSSGN